MFNADHTSHRETASSDQAAASGSDSLAQAAAPGPAVDRLRRTMRVYVVASTLIVIAGLMSWLVTSNPESTMTTIPMLVTFVAMAVRQRQELDKLTTR